MRFITLCNSSNKWHRTHRAGTRVQLHANIRTIPLGPDPLDSRRNIAKLDIFIPRREFAPRVGVVFVAFFHFLWILLEGLGDCFAAVHIECDN